MVDAQVVPSHQERAQQGRRLEICRRILGKKVHGLAGHILNEETVNFYTDQFSSV